MEAIPVEAKPPRTRAEINEEYTQIAAKVGDLEYRCRLMSLELKGYYENMHRCNQEKPYEESPPVATPKAHVCEAKDIQEETHYEEHA